MAGCARRLFLDRLPSLKAPEAPGGSRASLVGQHVVVVLDDIRVLRRVDQRIVLFAAFLLLSRLPSQRGILRSISARYPAPRSANKPSGVASGRGRAATLNAEQNRPKLRVATGD